MDPAAPFFFRYGPSCLPICKTISTVVWVSRPWWQGRLHWAKDWLHWWWWAIDWLHWWWCGGGAPAMVDPAAPLLLVCCPSVLGIDSAVEWIHRTRGFGRLSGWRRGRWRGRRRGWRRGERRGRRSDRFWRWKRRYGAASAHCGAAEILLCLRPHSLPLPSRESSITIKWE